MRFADKRIIAHAFCFHPGGWRRLTDADEDFLRHFEEFLDEALEVRRAKARTGGGGGNPVVKGGVNTSDVTPPVAMMKEDPNMPRGGHPETARFRSVTGKLGTHIVLLKPGDAPYPISQCGQSPHPNTGTTNGHE